MTKVGYDFEFTAGVHSGEELAMNVYRFSVEMVLSDENGENHSIAFNRIKHFIYTEIDSTIFIRVENRDKCLNLIDAGLDITTLPFEPTDQVINIVLFQKLNAIMEDKVVIVHSSLQSINGGNVIYFYESGEPAGLFEEPGWWSEPNLVHCDSRLLGSNVVNMQHSAIWRDLDLLWFSEITESEDSSVVVADFSKK